MKSYHNYIILYLKFNSSKRFDFKAAPRDEITPDFLGIFYNSLRCQKNKGKGLGKNVQNGLIEC